MNTYGIIIAVFASTGLWQLLQTIYINRKKKRTPLESGVLALLHDRIYDICRDAISDGEISIDGLENLEEIYRPYAALGGNGTGERLYKDVQELPKAEGR